MKTPAILTFVATLVAVTVGFTNGEMSAEPCIDIRGTADTELGFPVVIPAPVDITGAGALPSRIDLGEIQGTMSSVLTDPGEAGPGAQHWKLVHYFVDDDGDAFWTNDEAVCEPVEGDPSVCVLEDVMTVAGGTGKFANASGSMVNKGSATITDPTYQTTPFGSVTGEITGRICADGL